MATNYTDPMMESFIKYLEQATEDESKKIVEKYQDKMKEELETVRAKIVAQAGIKLSSMMSIQDMGRTVRIEIIKKEII